MLIDVTLKGDQAIAAIRQKRPGALGNPQFVNMLENLTSSIDNPAV